jgi:hypothetical protein
MIGLCTSLRTQQIDVIEQGFAETASRFAVVLGNIAHDCGEVG